jgi:hypothetical protein
VEEEPEADEERVQTVDIDAIEAIEEACSSSSTLTSWREVEEEPEADEGRVQTVDIDAIKAIEEDATSVCSSSPSSPNSVVMQSDQFCSFTVLSLMEFHDSEFDLSLKGGLLAAGRFTGQFDLGDSEADPDSDHEDLGGIGEGEDDDRDDEDICDVDRRELDDADEDNGMEFHDSNVGLDFALQDLNLQDYQGLDENGRGRRRLRRRDRGGDRHGRGAGQVSRGLGAGRSARGTTGLSTAS